MSFSRYMRDEINRDFARRVRSIGLLNRIETDADAYEEVSAPIYARQSVRLVPSADGGLENEGVVEFPWSPTAWGRLAAYAFFDEGGNLLYQLQPVVRMELSAGYSHLVKPGTLSIRLDLE